jgi:hypothetical protein
MTRTLVRIAPPALLAAAALAVAACGSTSGKPAAQAHRTQGTARAAVPPQTFMSQRYRFRVTLARDWSESDAQVAWNGKKLEGIGSPAFANFTDAATGRTLVAGAARVAKGMRLPKWRATMVRAAPAFCSESSSPRRTTLGGEPALSWTDACSDGYNVNKIAALHARRGYMVLLPSPRANGATGDRRVFEAIRRSFHFTRE